MTLKLITVSREALGKLRSKDDDEDLAMRCFSVYTITIIAICSLLVTPRQFLASPLHCWQVSGVGSFAKNYLDRLCLINGTYILPPNEHVLTYHPEIKDLMRWYAVTPLFIVLQIVPFGIAKLIWYTFNQQGGIEVSKAVSSAKQLQKASNYRNTELRRDEVKHIVDNINHVELQKKKLPKLKGFQQHQIRRYNCCDGFSSMYLTNLIIVVKVLYIISIPLNFVFISGFLGKRFFTLGIEFFHRFSLDKSVYFDEIFPTRAMCIGYVKVNNIISPQVLQCLLSMNIYNEKLFLFFWFWYVILFILGLTDLIITLIFRFSPLYRIRYFRKYLPDIKNSFDGKSVRDFFYHYCSVDTTFALRLMDSHLDHVSMTMVLSGLYDVYIAEESKMKMNQGIYGSDDTGAHDSSEQDIDIAINNQEMRQVANMPHSGEQ